MKLKLLLLSPLLLVLLVLFSLLGLFFLPGAPALAYKIAKPYLPLDLEIESIEGAFAGPLLINGLDYKDNETLVSVGQIALDWTPMCFAHQRFCLDSLRVSDINIVLPLSSETPEPEETAFELPDIHLPLSISLNEIQIERLQLQLGDQVYQLDQASLVLNTDQNKVALETLSIGHHESSISIEGWVDLSARFAHDIFIDINFKPEDLEALLGLDLSELELGSLVSQISLDGDADAFFVGLSVATSHPETGPANIQLESKIQPFEQVINITRLLASVGDTPSELLVSGSVTHFSDPQFDISANWSGIVYPLVNRVEPALIASPSGLLTLSGNLSEMVIALSTRVSGADIPDTELQLNAKGHTEALEAFNLVANTLGGQVTVSGSAGWMPVPIWDLTIQAQELDPAVFAPDWPGQLSLNLTTQGQLSEVSQPSLVARLDSLSGEIREQSLSGSGSFSLEGQRAQIDNLAVRLGAASVQLEGTVDELLALTFRLNIPDLSAVLPDAAGLLSLAGDVKGPLMTPAINARINGNSLAFQDNRVRSISGDVYTDLAGTQASNIKLLLSDITAAGETFESIELIASGYPNNHNAEIALVGAPLDLSLAVSGAWQNERWDGQLGALSLRREEVGRWRLSSPAPVQASASGFNLGNACLVQQDGGARLCLEAQQANGLTRASLALSDLSLSLLDPWLAGASIESSLNVSADYRQQGNQAPQANLTLNTTAGRVDTQGEQPDLSLDPIVLTAQLMNDRLTARLESDFSAMDGRILADVTVGQFSSQQNLEGNLNINMSDLSIVSVFVPDVQNLLGQIIANFTLGGTLSVPLVSGQFEYANGSAEIPALGIRLSPLSVKLVSEGDQSEQLSLMGLIGSGNGLINLDGQYDLQRQMGNLTLKGDSFQAMDTEISVRISPDLNVRVDEDAIRLGGSVTIPYARISPPKQQMQSVVRASEDVVFTEDQDDGLTQRNLPLLTDLSVILGDSVEVDAFGFKGRLLGRLRITDDAQTTTRASGSIQVESGDYRLFGQDLNISRGSLVYTGGPIDNPGLDLRVSRFVGTVEAGARITGTIRAPEMTLFSVPAMSDSSIMSYLVLGRGPGESSASEQSMMMQAAMALTLQGGNSITGQLQQGLNLDEFGFASDDAGDSAFFIGKYLTPRLYIRYGISLLESMEMLTLSYRLSSMWRVETQSSNLGSGADIFYTRER